MRRLISRRRLLGTAAAAGGAFGLEALAPARAARQSWAARPPAGMERLSLPGKVVRVTGTGTLQPGGLWPTREAARALLERAMRELTGKSDLGEAFRLFVHPADRVAIKPNGIGGRRAQSMASNKELVLEIVRGLLAAGVPAGSISVYEQYESFLWGTRVVGAGRKLDPGFPAGVAAVVHGNRDAVMDSLAVGGVSTRFVRPLTEASAVINVPLIKDHSNCGYTGALKNITHGSIVNPEAFHAHRSSPQIAHLYAQDVVKSRVVLHLTDAFKVLYDGGPLDRRPECRVAHHSVYASTDPVALDVVGWALCDELRRANGLPALAQSGREPTYIRVAGELGLGIFERARIGLRSVAA
ncbi:MAG: DUF362 domain-containing protein [Deltaproteobacteria bacterium]|nr:DUF362 domain-containing protein [Deltaproteobacteria bacterium]